MAFGHRFLCDLLDHFVPAALGPPAMNGAARWVFLRFTGRRHESQEGEFSHGVVLV